MKDFQIKDIRNNFEIIDDITILEKKIEQQLGKQVALVAYVEADNLQTDSY